jgi:hypothetical protein
MRREVQNGLHHEGFSIKESYPYASMKSQNKQHSNENGKLNQLFLEKVASIIPVPYYWGWTIFAGIVFLCTSIAIFYFENSFSYILTFFILSILMAQQPIIVIWAHKKMKLLKEYLKEIIELPEGEILKWYEDQMATIFDDKKMFVSGVLVTILVHLMGLDQFGFTFQSFYSKAILMTDYILVHILMGAGLYPLLCTALMIYNVSKLPMNINILVSKNLQIKGLLYSKFTICAASVYTVWGCFHLSTPAKLSTVWDISWFSLFALLLLVYFILPQYSIHQMIMKTKKEKLTMFSKQMSAKAKEAFSNPTKDNILCLRNFLDIEHQLDEMCVWPFGSYELLHIVLIVIIPIMVVLLEILFRITR